MKAQIEGFIILFPGLCELDPDKLVEMNKEDIRVIRDHALKQLKKSELQHSVRESLEITVTLMGKLLEEGQSSA
jgi:hypothetical protein|tara:strand:+ start:3828 stop:4049 length:222 start_codon:yes stop_codon:yes gene_type:complete